MANNRGDLKSHWNGKAGKEVTPVKETGGYLIHSQFINPNSYDLWVWLYAKPAKEVTEDTIPFARFTVSCGESPRNNGAVITEWGFPIEIDNGISYLVSQSHEKVELKEAYKPIQVQIFYR